MTVGLRLADQCEEWMRLIANRMGALHARLKRRRAATCERIKKSWFGRAGSLQFDAGCYKLRREPRYEIEPPVDGVFLGRRVGRQPRNAYGWVYVLVDFEKFRLLVHLVSSLFLWLVLGAKRQYSTNPSTLVAPYLAVACGEIAVCSQTIINKAARSTYYVHMVPHI